MLQKLGYALALWATWLICRLNHYQINHAFKICSTKKSTSDAGMSSVLFFILTDNIRRVHSNEWQSWKTWHWRQRNCHFDSGWKNGTWCWKRTVKGAAVHRSFFSIICTIMYYMLTVSLTDCYSNIKRVWIYINFLFFSNGRYGCVGLLLSHKWLGQEYQKIFIVRETQELGNLWVCEKNLAQVLVVEKFNLEISRWK